MRITPEANRSGGTETRDLWRGAIALSLLAAGALFILSACQAPLDQKRGGLNEFCNGSDKQCRKGLVCQDGVCTSLNNAPEVCNTVCGRFDDCGASVSGCKDSCLITLQSWSRQTTEAYETCYEATSCSTIASTSKPWNICYQELELKDDREQRCNKLEEHSQTCLNDIGGDYSEEMRSFENACERKARTVPERNWSKTEKCLEHADKAQIQCGELFRCINDKFSLGSKAFPTSRPD